MNYFTPDLILRVGSPDDAIADAASEEWEVVHERYLKHLDSIKPRLPKSVQSLLANYCLHDAKVLALGNPEEDAKKLTFILRLAAPRTQLLRLTYRLASDPKWTFHREIGEEAASEIWLYDELDISSGNEYPVFQQSIVFNAGVELKLDFYDLDLELYNTVPIPYEGRQTSPLRSAS
jgi:hypothetical protein